MTVRDAAGAILTKAQLEAKTTIVVQPQLRTIDETIYDHFTLPGKKTHDGDRKIKYRVGQVVSQAEIDALYPAGTFTSITPATGPIAGGTDVTIKGTNFSGVTAVTIGVACTNVVVVDDETVTCTTGATTAGAKDVVLTDDAGTITGTGAYTYV